MPKAPPMPRKKTSKPKSTITTKSLVVRATDDYAAWVMAFAEFRRATYARLIDEALADYAEKTGFKKPPVRT
jgi:hypothetical protein